MTLILCLHKNVTEAEKLAMVAENVSLAGLESGTLDNLDLGAGGSGHVGEVDRGTFRERERARFGQNRHTFGAQLVNRLRQRTRGAPADVVDGMPLAWLRLALLHQDPHVAEAGRAVLNGVSSPFELRLLSAELRQHPTKNLI